MEGKFFKAYRYQTIITEDILRRLDKYFHTLSDTVEYEFTTSDGAAYEKCTLSDILDYPNPKTRKITSIAVHAKIRVINFHSTVVKLQLLDASEKTLSATIAMWNATPEEIHIIPDKIAEILNLAKAPYAWLYSKWTYFLFLEAVMIGLSFLTTMYTKGLHIFERIFISILLGFLEGAILGAIYFKLVPMAFPETTFCIGEQSNRHEQLKKKRNIVFISILLGLLVGGLSSLIVYLITN